MIVETIAVILVSLLLVVYYYGRAPKPLHASETERPNPRPDATPETLRAMIEQFEEKLPIMPGLRTELVLTTTASRKKRTFVLFMSMAGRPVTKSVSRCWNLCRGS